MTVSSGKILAVANQKGGVGKTTTALTLGAALSRNGFKVLLADMDPHICASVHMRIFPQNGEYTVLDLLRQAENVATWRQAVRNIPGQDWNMIGGDTHLADIESEWRDKKNKGFVLKDLLTEAQKEYDFILLDCPPQMSVLLVNALVAADMVIIPIQTDYLAVHGLKLLFETLRLLESALGRAVPYRALATMHDKRTNACSRVLELLRDKLGSAVFNAVIPMDTRLREASAQGCVVYDIAEKSRGAQAYEQLAKEVIALW